MDKTEKNFGKLERERQTQSRNGKGVWGDLHRKREARFDTEIQRDCVWNGKISIRWGSRSSKINNRTACKNARKRERERGRDGGAAENRRRGGWGVFFLQPGHRGHGRGKTLFQAIAE